jgi:hypothetical protein
MPAPAIHLKHAERPPVQHQEPGQGRGDVAEDERGARYQPPRQGGLELGGPGDEQVAPRARQFDMHVGQVNLRGQSSQGAADHPGGKGELAHRRSDVLFHDSFRKTFIRGLWHGDNAARRRPAPAFTISA